MYGLFAPTIRNVIIVIKVENVIKRSTVVLGRFREFDNGKQNAIFVYAIIQLIIIYNYIIQIIIFVICVYAIYIQLYTYKKKLLNVIFKRLRLIVTLN